MAEITTQKGHRLVTGFIARDAEYTVNERNGRSQAQLKFSVKKDETRNTDGSFNAEWENCICWRQMADYGSSLDLRKGDYVLVTGKIDSRQGQNGNIYTSLICDFIMRMPRPGENVIQNISEDITIDSSSIDDSELPF